MNDATQFFDTVAGAGGGYEIERSLRFNSSDSAYCGRFPASGGNQRTFTVSFWCKRAALGTEQGLFSTDNASFTIKFTSTDNLFVQFVIGNNIAWSTNAVFRDTSAWYYVTVAIDTTQASSANAVKIYVNNALQSLVFTAFSGSYNQNADTGYNGTGAQSIGRGFTGAVFQYANCYLADLYSIDGQALDPSSFGEFDTNGVWQPKAYEGNYGTNGFHLPFSDNSTAAALGTDTSGAGNDWTVNNLSVTGAINIGYPQALTAGSGSVTNPSRAFDGSTGTEAIANTSDTITFTPPTPISFSTKLEFWTSNGNGPGFNDQRYSFNGGAEVTCSGGEWTTVVNGSGTLTSLAIRNTAGAISRLNAVRVDNNILLYNSGADNDSLVDSPTNYGTDSGAGGEVRGNYATWNPLANGAGTLSNGNLDLGNSSPDTRCNSTISVSSGKWYYEITLNTLGTNSSAGIGQNQIINAWPGNDALSYAYELDNARTAQSGSLVAYGSALTAGDIFMCAFDLDNSKIFFGKNGTWFNSSNPATGTNPAFTLAAGSYCPIGRPYGGGSFSLNAGQRPFAYTAPSGFKALCTTNLAEPTIADGSTAMDVVTYTGNGSTQTISGLNFSPDFVWIKQRDTTRNHVLYDTVRGATKALLSSTADSELTYSTSLTAFNSDGFALGSDDKSNGSSGTYVAWTWDAGSSTVTNTQGSITSQVRANPGAGFSVVTYTGGGVDGTVGHGLGVSPVLYIYKNRSSALNWGVCYTIVDGSLDFMYLNLTNGAGNASQALPTSTVLSMQASANDVINGNNYVAYCFAPVAGYSSFGSYTGNGSADGPFVYTGFRPKFLLIKYSSGVNSWMMQDSARDTYNPCPLNLTANGSGAENDYKSSLPNDMLSNGFKLRNTNDAWNGSGGTYIYAAFAEHPFAYARAR